MLDEPARLDHPRVDLAGLKSVPAERVVDAVELSRRSWEEREDGTERDRALRNIAADFEQVKAYRSGTLQDVAAGLVSAHTQRNERLKMLSRAGLGLALGGFFSVMAGFAPGLAIGAAGVVVAAGAALVRQDSPALNALGRLPSYAGVAGQVDETRSLMDALSRHDERVSIEEQGVWLGDNYLPFG